MKTSILIYCKNDSQTIQQCINSIFDSNHIDYVIIVDDASTDGSWSKICNLFQQDDQNSEHFSCNIGNTLVFVAKNEFDSNIYETLINSLDKVWDSNYIGFLEATHRITADCIDKCLQRFDNNIGAILTDQEDLLCGYPINTYYTDHPKFCLFNKEVISKIQVANLKTVYELYKEISKFCIIESIPEILVKLCQKENLAQISQ